MAIILVATTDTIDNTVQFNVPQPIEDTYVPRGIARHTGTQAIAALGAADQTRFQLNLEFPGNYEYRLKGLSVAFESDDTVNDFELTAGGIILNDATVNDVRYTVEAPPASFRGGQQNKIVNWQKMVEMPDVLVSGAEGESTFIEFWDVSTDASSAGDFFWYIEWFFYDVSQARNWPIHAPFPVVCI